AGGPVFVCPAARPFGRKGARSRMKTTRAPNGSSLCRHAAIVALTLASGAVHCAGNPQSDATRGTSAVVAADDASAADARVATTPPPRDQPPQAAYEPFGDSLTAMGTDGSTQALTVKVADAPNGDMLLDISYVIHLATPNESFNYDIYMAVNDLGISPSMPVLGALSGTALPRSQLQADFNLVSWLTPI